MTNQQQQPRRSPRPELRAGDHVTIEQPSGDRLHREIVPGGNAAKLGVWLTPAHWANVATLERDGWQITSHELVRSSHDSSTTTTGEQ